MPSRSIKRSLKVYKGPRGGTYVLTKAGRKRYVKLSRTQGPCWPGYERVPGTKRYAKGSCRRASRAYAAGKKKRSSRKCRPGSKKFAKVVNGRCIRFGDRSMTIKKGQPGRKRSFCARHRCRLKRDPATAGFQSCKKWGCWTSS